MHDLLIIGGSAVATAAGVYAARANVDVKIVATEWGGEVATSGEIGNWPGVIQTEGLKLADEFLAHLKANKLEPELGVPIEAIIKNADGTLTAKGKKNGSAVTYQAKAIIVGTGVHPRELAVPGEKALRNKGVSYCSVCDLPLFRGKVVAVVGGGNSALESVLMATKIASNVIMLTLNPELQGEQVYIEQVKKLPNVEVIYHANTKEIIGDQVVKAVKYEDTNTKEMKQIATQGVFIHIGMIANSGLVKSAGVALDEFGQIVIDPLCRTNVPGLFAAGDVTNIPYKQIAIAAGQGVTAALAAIDYIRKLR
ncbi:FAD-dependent oxidoreductase [Candidatus Berkelbacteria bacterium]|nr:FAD-dependent oxidoreductase [Candidatus Berkelbacteria bacterium]